MSAFLPRLRRWTLLDSCWSLFGPCVWFSQSSETGQRVFLEKELTCSVSLPPPLPELVWQMPFHFAIDENVDLWVFPFHPLVTCFPSVGWERWLLSGTCEAL